MTKRAERCTHRVRVTMQMVGRDERKRNTFRCRSRIDSSILVDAPSRTCSSGLKFESTRRLLFRQVLASELSRVACGNAPGGRESRRALLTIPNVARLWCSAENQAGAYLDVGRLATRSRKPGFAAFSARLKPKSPALSRGQEGPRGETRPREEGSEGGSNANSTTMVTFYGSESSIACRSRGERQ